MMNWFISLAHAANEEINQFIINHSFFIF